MNNYSIIKSFGSGAYGQVFKAKHIASLDTVAIKVVKIVQDNEALLIALLRELRVLKALAEDSENHHTVKLKDAFFQTSDGPNAN